MNLLKNIALPMVLILAVLVSAVSAEVNGGEIAPIIIDVRNEAEWAAGHLEGAVLIPHERIGEEISRVTTDRKAKIYLYCRTGRRTAIAVDALKKAGYGNLVNLETVENAAKVLNRGVVK